MVSRIA